MMARGPLTATLKDLFGRHLGWQCALGGSWPRLRGTRTTTVVPAAGQAMAAKGAGLLEGHKILEDHRGDRLYLEA